MHTGITMEKLTDTLSIHVSQAHRFGTDAFLLAAFARAQMGDKACDLGTGCGIIPLLWMRDEDTAPFLVYGVDIQEEAVSLFEKTVSHCGLWRRVLPVCQDLRELDLPAGTFDLVTCNPPYKKMETGLLSDTESDKLARHELGCTLEDVCAAAGRLLRFGGRFCLCQRPDRLVDILAAMREAGMEPKRLRFVHQRPDKSPWLVLVEGRRGGRPHLQVAPPLVMEEPGGGFSREVLEIYGKA